MAIRKGLVQPPPQNAKPLQPITHNVQGRQVVKTREPSRIITPNESQPVARPKLRESVQPVRGIIVDASGRPLRGLSKATMDAHREVNEALTEKCPRCGEMRTRAQMKTIIPNAERPSNPLVICISCVETSYKDPRNEGDRWRPQVPAVRFDRERGQPYNAHRAGVSIADLVTKDTYHNERDVEAKYRPDNLAGEGRWSGGGRAGHAVSDDTLAQSRERAAKATSRRK